MKIEEAGEEDAEDILDLQRIAYQSEARLYDDYSIPPLTQTLDEIKGDIDELLVLKAVADGGIVGSVRARMLDRSCYIGRLIVHPDYQDRGTGSRLMERIEHDFRQARRFELFTGHVSRKNLYLYEKSGYREFRRERVSANLELIYLEKRTR